MKTMSSHRLPVVLLAIFIATHGNINAQVGEIRDVASHDDLTLVLREALQADPMKSMEVSQGEDPAPASRPTDLLSQSDIISFGGLAALVPKRAILQIPENLANRVELARGAKLVSWSEFYAVNYGWITTIEVSRLQAEGNEPMGEANVKLMGTSKNLIVATYQRGPISVLPLTPEAQIKLSKL